jgi:F-type H+-transporting ATPase subunit epsilon
LAERGKFEAQVLTPDGPVFEGELEQLSTRTEVGEVGILARHAPMVARLVPAELRLHLGGDEVRRYAQGEGWLEVFANRARVLVAEAAEPGDLDVGQLRERLSDAERREGEAEEGSAQREQAARDRMRAEAFIRIAENS